MLALMVTYDYNNQLMGLEMTTFQYATDRMLVGHDHDWSNKVLGNEMKKKNCDKGTSKLLVCFTHTELLFPFPQLTGEL